MAKTGFSKPSLARRILRTFLRFLIGRLLFVLTKFEVRGADNIPQSGPVIVVANHFHFTDPAYLIYAAPRPMEFIAGRLAPNANKFVTIFPKLYGVLRAFRGGYSRSTLDGALSALDQGYPVALFPEGGAWAQVLRPARPGAAYLAVESGAIVVPIGIIGAPQVLKRGRSPLTINIGSPIGPFTAQNTAKARREEINAISKEIMQSIADLLPPEQQGVFAKDKAVRDQAKDAAIYPFSRKNMRGT